MRMDVDTGCCVPESTETLLAQQHQLECGIRVVQMFPTGTKELNLLPGFSRHENFRGVFHYRPESISPDKIDFCSLRGSENEILNLGPYSKADIFKRLKNGEEGIFITEYTPGGVEIRSAFGTVKTVAIQRDYFERTKEPESIIVIGAPPERVLSFLKKEM